jgi:hypothetical protein
MSILCILCKEQTIDTIITKIPKTNFVFVKKKKENLSFAQQQKKKKRRKKKGGEKYERKKKGDREIWVLKKNLE